MSFSEPDPGFFETYSLRAAKVIQQRTLRSGRIRQNSRPYCHTLEDKKGRDVSKMWKYASWLHLEVRSHLDMLVGSKTNRFPLNSCNSMTSTYLRHFCHFPLVTLVMSLKLKLTSCCRHDVLHQASCRHTNNSLTPTSTHQKIEQSLHVSDYSLIVITTELDRLYF